MTADCNDGLKDLCADFFEGGLSDLIKPALWGSGRASTAAGIGTSSRGPPSLVSPPCSVGSLGFEDDDGSRGDLEDEHFADVGGKDGAIHRALDESRRGQRILCQAGNQSLPIQVQIKTL